MTYFFSIIMICIGIVGYGFFYNLSKDFINPSGITLLIWGFIAGLASLHLTALETEWGPIMYITVLCFPLMVFMGGIAAHRRVKATKRSIKFTDAYILLSRILFFFSLICCIVIWSQNGFGLAFNSTNVDKKLWTEDTSAIIESGTYYMNFIGVNSLAELLFKKNIRRKTKFYLVFTIFFSLFYNIAIAFSRGNLLIFIFGAAYLITRKFRIKFRTLMIAGASVFAFLLVMMEIRLTRKESMVYMAIENHRVLSSFYTYTALNLENLNKLITIGPSWGIVHRTFQGVIRLLLPWTPMLESNIVTYGYFNACPLCYSFYDDLGLIGVIIYSFLFYYVIGLIYKKSQIDSRYMLLMVALQKPIWVSFFGNYFTDARAYIIPYILQLLLIFSMKCVIRKGSYGEKIQ